jgi:diaminopimelate decarboxylase
LPPEHWGLSTLSGRGLAIGETALDDLLERFGSPLFVVDGQRLDENAAAFQARPSGREHGCEVFYSYKTNPILGVLRLLAEVGIGAEVISPYELWLARRIGVRPERIIYNGPAKSDESIRQAIELGIEAINCNHREEIAHVAGLAQEVGGRARVGIRITTDDSWANQFGIPLASGEAMTAFAEARSMPMLDVVGIHAHRGGMIRAEDELRRFAAAILAFAGELSTKIDLAVETLDFGGSLGVPTVDLLHPRDRRLNQALHWAQPVPNTVSALTIDRYVDVLLGQVDQHFAGSPRARPRVLIEPGRAMTGNAQLLLTRVVSIKQTREVRIAVLDAGINVAESVRSEYHQVFPIADCSNRRARTHSLVGPICSPGDTLYPAVRLPELVVGDSLAIMDAGAYFVPFSTSFSFPRPAVVLVADGKCTLLRRPEAFEDLVSNDVHEAPNSVRQ